MTFVDNNIFQSSTVSQHDEGKFPLGFSARDNIYRHLAVFADSRGWSRR